MKAKTPKAKKIKAPPLLVHVEVLQNGATLLATAQPLKRYGTLALTSHGNGPFVLPHYPLPEGQLEFLRFTPQGLKLVVDHKWEGFCTSKGELIHIARGERGRRTLVLHKSDYASITSDDLRIMIKLAPPTAKKAPQARRGNDPAYNRSVLHMALPTREEKRVTLIGAAAAAFLVGCVCFGLLQRPVHQPTQLRDISEEYMLPFVAPEHLKQAPEALQQALDRRQEVRSVLDYYGSFTSVLMGWPVYDTHGVYATTIDMYEKLHADAREELQRKAEHQQEVDRLQAMKSGVGVLSIPAVMGESMNGSMLRVIDKIDVMQKALAVNLKARRAITPLFPKDPDYDWTEYKNPSIKDDHMIEYLSQIRPFNKMTDEEMMYAEAEALAARAKRKQARILRHHEGKEQLGPGGPGPVGMPDGAKFASFASDMDFMLADEKLNQLQGSEYGLTAKPGVPRVKEPLVGEIEPGLIERYIKENRFQLQLCYELALRRNEGAAGTMEWYWRIDSRGLISDLALVSTNIADQRMAECIRRKISAWRFPRPRRGSVEVSYPFEFAPSKG